MKHFRRARRIRRPTRPQLVALVVIVGFASGFVAASIRRHDTTARASLVATQSQPHGSTRPSKSVTTATHQCVRLVSTHTPGGHIAAAYRFASRRSVDHGSRPANPYPPCRAGHRTTVLLS